MSASLNTVAGTLYEDFVAPLRPKSDSRASLFMKLIVVVVGVICVLLIFVVERLGSIMQMAISLTSMTHGAMIYIISVGLFFPWVNSQGALWGSASSLAFMAFIVGGSQYYALTGQLQFPSKVVSVEQCPLSTVVSNYTGIGTPVLAEGVPHVFQLSYMYFCAVGTLAGLLVGLTVSYMTGWQDLSTLDPRLVVPWVRSFLPPSSVKDPVVEEELKLIKNKSSVKILVNGV